MVLKGADLDHNDGDDNDLATRAARGDSMAYGALMRTWQSPLWRIARRYTGDAGEAEDIVQDVFVAFWRKLGEAGPPANVGRYLRRATLNACRDWSRRRAVRTFFFRAAPLDDVQHGQRSTPSDNSQDYELSTLDALIAVLPAGLKEPLILCALEGLNHKQAGDVLGLTAKAIENRIGRAKVQLRTKWPRATPDQTESV
jgi:RNA polymerase sigma-70 factor (ECF subfamily)